MYFGAHVKSSGGVWHAIENGVDIGAEAVQFFAGSPRTWAPTVYKDKDAAQFREARAASPIRFVLIHTIYLINLASENEDFYEKSVTSLCGALAAADQLGADAIVTHIGSHQGARHDDRGRKRRGRIKYAVHDVVANDDHTIALGTATATRNGKTLEYRTAEIFHIRDGKAVERWAFSDDTEAIVAFFA